MPHKIKNNLYNYYTKNEFIIIYTSLVLHIKNFI